MVEEKLIIDRQFLESKSKDKLVEMILRFVQAHVETTQWFTELDNHIHLLNEKVNSLSSTFK